jgi:hypothetical protein
MHEAHGADGNGGSAEGRPPARVQRGWLVGLEGRGSELDRAATRLGAALAALHATGGADGAPLAPRPWARLLSVRDGAGGGVGPVAHDLHGRLCEVLRDPVVRACVTAVDRSWRPRARVYGAVGVETVEALVGARRGSPSALLPAARPTARTEPGVALGHPAWDVTCALAALDALDPRPRPLAGSRSTFLVAYLHAGGPQPLPAPPWGCVLALTSAAALLDAPHDEATSETVDVLLLRARTAAWWARRRTA